MSDDTDRLTASPRQATTCPNCACPMFPPRCAPCGYVEPVIVCAAGCCDDDDPDEPTSDLLDDGLPPLPPDTDPPGGSD